MESMQFYAGFGKGVIRFPEALFPVEGFRGIHDDPCIRLMVLAAGDERMAIASVELVNVPPKAISLCQKMIQHETGVPLSRIWIHATHAISTMHEPGPMGPPNQRRPETERDIEQRTCFFAAIEKAMTEAAKQAASDFGPASFGWASGECDANVNRDVLTPHGWWTGLNPQEPSNKKMSVLRVENLSGQPKGFLISYGIKPCALDNAGMQDHTRLVSSDVCGVCSGIMEQQFGVPALFCVSAAGDQVPREMALLDNVIGPGKYVQKDFGVAQGLEMVSRVGKLLGDTAVSVGNLAVCDQTHTAIRFDRVSFFWPGRDRQTVSPAAEPSPEALVSTGDLQVTAEVFTIGKAAFVAEKPEVNVRTELELLKASPYAHTCLICMVNGGMKYMPDALAYERNTFEAQSSLLLPGAAEEFVKTVVGKLHEMKEA